MILGRKPHNFLEHINKEKIAKFIRRETFTNYIQKIKLVKLFQKNTYKRYINNNILKNVSWKSPRTIGATVLVLVLVSGGIFYFSTTTAAVSITVNSQNAGYAQDKTEAEQIVQNVLKLQGQVSGQVASTSDEIEYNRVRVSDDTYAENKVSVAALSSLIKPYIDGCSIQIGEETVAYLGSSQEADLVLTKYKEYFTKPSDTNVINSAEFVEPVSKVAVNIDPGKVKSVDEVLKIMLHGDTAAKDYTIQENDSLWQIARNNDMLTDEIISANPGFTEDSILQPGQVIKLVKVEPYLTVVSKGTKVVKEVIPFDVETKTDTKLGYGKSVVKQAGKDGEKKVTYDYVEENGKVVKKQVLKEEVVNEPVKQIIAKGPTGRSTIYVGTSRGSGSVRGMQWPLSGQITSYYGYRSRGFHTGIDIDGVTGQPFYAAAAGEVVMSGWASGYGYCILVDHGDGVVTRYGHASKLLVGVGDSVSAGKHIGNVGSTGNSTGSHLHFEILVNGSTVNPLDYI